MSQLQIVEVLFGCKVVFFLIFLFGTCIIFKAGRDGDAEARINGYFVMFIGLFCYLLTSLFYKSERNKIGETELTEELNEELKTKDIYFNNEKLPEGAISAEIITEKGYVYTITDDAIYIYQ